MDNGVGRDSPVLFWGDPTSTCPLKETHFEESQVGIF